MTDGLKFEHALWWPGRIGGSIQRYLDHQPDSDKAVRLLPKETRRRTAIQAGGFNGIWPLRLARKFQRVITAECSPENYRCLRANVEHEPRIETHEAALADREGETTFIINPKNCGGGKCRELSRPKDVGITVRTMTIDSLDLKDVDLIYLDIEGCEVSALRGARATIERCRPVIAAESWLHGEKMRPEWQWTEASLIKMMRSWGYKEAHRVSHDIIFSPE